MISRSEVPKYLQYGSFFEMLDASDDEKFEVPTDCLKADLTIESDQDLGHLLRSVRFWGTYEIPIEILHYALKNAKGAYVKSLVDEFPEFADYLSKIIVLKFCKPEEAISLAIELKLGVEVVKILHVEMGCLAAPHQLEFAAIHDDLPSFLFCLEKLIENRRIVVPFKDSALRKRLMDVAVANSSLQVLRYAHMQQWSLDAALPLAVSTSTLEVVRFLHEDCGQAYEEKFTMGCACLAKSGNLELVRYLHQSGCPWNVDVCAVFALYNHLDCLTYAHENGCPWDERTCVYAALHGHLRCLEYAHLHGCPWDNSILVTAATYDHVDCLQYAHQRGCVLHRKVSETALANGSWACLKYTLRQGVLREELLDVLKLILFCVIVLVMRFFYSRSSILDLLVVSLTFMTLARLMLVFEPVITKHLHPGVNLLFYVFALLGGSYFVIFLQMSWNN